MAGLHFCIINASSAEVLAQLYEPRQRGCVLRLGCVHASRSTQYDQVGQGIYLALSLSVSNRKTKCSSAIAWALLCICPSMIMYQGASPRAQHEAVRLIPSSAVTSMPENKWKNLTHGRLSLTALSQSMHCAFTWGVVTGNSTSNDIWPTQESGDVRYLPAPIPMPTSYLISCVLRSRSRS